MECVLVYGCLMSVLIQDAIFIKMYFILSFAQSVVLNFMFGQLTACPYLSVFDVGFYILLQVMIT